ncbi:MAG TPA: low temperature requirement protein A [Solirubrobacteraceae bacterium]|nr:low temperature requirement protein A [Solirubrobacteraceae bacterium]
MSTLSEGRTPRLTATMREGERVTPLELFFDLVFVLALTQCTTLMARTPTWIGLLKGVLALGMLWWAWTGYAWLTSVVDPEEGSVRLVIFTAMAAMLVAALCVPGAFGSEALLFACAYAVVRAAHIALFTIASREDPVLRHSVAGLAYSTAIGAGLLFVAAATSGALQIGLWGLALVLDMGGPFLFGADGWKLVPGHFAERHGLIVLIALGESIVALGVGARAVIDADVVLAAVLGVIVAATLWWVYFDVTALVAERRLSNAKEGRERNELARDSYSYLHFPMVAGIALLAVGLKVTIEHDGDDPLKLVPTAALLGGAAAYLLAHVAFRLRNVQSLSGRRLVCALVLLALVPVTLALKTSSLETLAILAAVLSLLIVYEVTRYADVRERVRHQGSPGPGPPP